MSEPTIARHGDAYVSETPGAHHEVVVHVQAETLWMTDRQARDLFLCLADLFPSLLPVREPAHLDGYGFSRAQEAVAAAAPPAGVDGYAHPRGAPVVIPVKPCCGVLAGDVCDCASFAASAYDAFASPLKVGWKR